MIIRRGSQGDLVKTLQQKLGERGFYTTDVDGIYGTGTENAVKAFQRSQGLPADGIAGPQVYRALGMTDIAETKEWKPSRSSRPVRMKSFAELEKPKEPIAEDSKGEVTKGKTSGSAMQFRARSIAELFKEPISEEPKREVIERTQIFISYSHKDKKWLERLKVHLKPLMQQKNVVLWDDTLIKPGAKWRDEIEKGLALTKVAILLVSADFLASDFITTKELPSLLAAAASEGAVILPLIVSWCRFEETESLSQFQAVNPPSQPLGATTRNKQEAIFVKLTKAVEDTFKS